MTHPPARSGVRTLRPATQLVHGGGMRSPFGETSEALYLTQGYVFDSMEASTRVARYLASNFELASWRCSSYWRSPSKLRTFRLAR